MIESLRRQEFHLTVFAREHHDQLIFRTVLGQQHLVCLQDFSIDLNVQLNHHQTVFGAQQQPRLIDQAAAVDVREVAQQRQLDAVQQFERFQRVPVAELVFADYAMQLVQRIDPLVSLRFAVDHHELRELLFAVLVLRVRFVTERLTGRLTAVGALGQHAGAHLEDTADVLLVRVNHLRLADARDAKVLVSHVDQRVHRDERIVEVADRVADTTRKVRVAVVVRVQRAEATVAHQAHAVAVVGERVRSEVRCCSSQIVEEQFEITDDHEHSRPALLHAAFGFRNFYIAFGREEFSS